MIEPTLTRPAYSQLRREAASQGELARRDWQPLIDESQRGPLMDVVARVAEQLQDPAQILQATRNASQQGGTPLRWSVGELAGGLTGIALFYGYLAACFPGQGWDMLAWRYLSTVAEESRKAPVGGVSLYAGTGGLVCTLHVLNTGNGTYQKILKSARQSLCQQIMMYQWRRPAQSKGVAEHDYDTISGAAGVLSALLLLEQPDEQVLTAIERLLDYLIWLGEPDQPRGRERWFVPPELLHIVEGRPPDFSAGIFNCGLAHGIPGPLAALSLAWLQGYRFPGLRETIASLSTWLIQHRLTDQWGGNWPHVVPLAAAQSPAAWQALPGGRAGWCYGGPGVARSLWLAGTALGDVAICQVATEAIEAALQRPAALRNIFSPTLCHGVAGFLQICLHFAHESGSTQINAGIPTLVDDLLGMFDPQAPFGFRDIERVGVAVDRPGWLSGAAGVVMTLLSAVTDVAPTWDRCLLLS